jgi:hypothetical protein
MARFHHDSNYGTVGGMFDGFVSYMGVKLFRYSYGGKPY